MNRCLYLASAYEHALEHQDKGMSWGAYCGMAIDKISSAGINIYTRPKTVQQMNIMFRKNETFRPYSTSPVSEVKLFSLFPEAKKMLESWARKNIEQLSSDSAREYIADCIIPHCLRMCNEELSTHGDEQFSEKEFLQQVGLRSVTVKTAWRWLRLLGFSYAKKKIILH